LQATAHFIQIGSHKITPAVKVLQISPLVSPCFSIMKITCYSALIAVMALTQMSLGQATAILDEEVALSMTFPDGPPEKATLRDVQFVQDVLIYTFNEAFSTDERELSAIAGHFKLPDGLGKDDEDGGKRRLGFLDPNASPEERMKVLLANAWWRRPENQEENYKGSASPYRIKGYTLPPPTWMVSYGCRFCPPNRNHAPIPGVRFPAIKPPRLMKEDDDGKNIQAWADAVCDILSNSNIVKFQGVTDCVITFTD
jgi:hypothetical protein